MKKLFVLFLLVALVPFAVGCFGGDGDDDSVLDYTTLTNVVSLPNELVAPANMRAAAKISYKNLYLNIGGKKFTYSATKSPEYDAANNSWKITFESTMTGTEAAAFRTQTAATVEVYDGTNTAAPVKLATAVVNLNISSTSKVVPEIVVSYDDTAKTLEIVTIDGVAPTEHPTNTVTPPATFSVQLVVATNSVTLTKLGATAPLDTDYKTIATITAPVFTITFEDAYALPTGVTSLADIRWVIYVKNVNTDTDFTLDSSVAADKALFSISAVTGDAKSINVTVIGDSIKKLVKNTKYQVTFADSNLTNADKDVLAPATYLFKTPAE